LNLTSFHGVFAPNFKHRDRIVPQRAQRAVEGDKPVAPMSWMQRLKRVFAIDIAYRDVGKGREQGAIASRLARAPAKRVWRFARSARSLARVPISACGGRLRVIACIEDTPLIAKILGHVRRREVLIGNTSRSPPVLQPELTLT